MADQGNSKYKLVHWDGEQNQADDIDELSEDHKGVEITLDKTKDFVAGIVTAAGVFGTCPEEYRAFIYIEKDGELLDVDEYFYEYLLSARDEKSSLTKAEEPEDKKGWKISLLSEGDKCEYFSKSRDYIDGIRYGLKIMGYNDQLKHEDGEITNIVEIKKDNEVVDPTTIYEDWSVSTPFKNFDQLIERLKQNDD